ncbi:unnamed protein product, partial [Mesorhabditis spiculigera]
MQTTFQARPDSLDNPVAQAEVAAPEDREKLETREMVEIPALQGQAANLGHLDAEVEACRGPRDPQDPLGHQETRAGLVPPIGRGMWVRAARPAISDHPAVLVFKANPVTMGKAGSQAKTPVIAPVRSVRFPEMNFKKTSGPKLSRENGPELKLVLGFGE